MKIGDYVAYHETVGLIQGGRGIAQWCVRLLNGSLLLLHEDEIRVLPCAPVVEFVRPDGTGCAGPIVNYDDWGTGAWTIQVAPLHEVTAPVEWFRFTLAPAVCALPGCGKPLDAGATSCWMCGNSV